MEEDDKKEEVIKSENNELTLSNKIILICVALFLIFGFLYNKTDIFEKKEKFYSNDIEIKDDYHNFYKEDEEEKEIDPNLEKYLSLNNTVEQIDKDYEINTYKIFDGEIKLIKDLNIVIGLEIDSDKCYTINTLYYANNNTYSFFEKEIGNRFFISNNYDIEIVNCLENGIEFKIISNIDSYNDFSDIAQDESITFMSYGKIKVTVNKIEKKSKDEIDCELEVKYNGNSEVLNWNIAEQQKKNFGQYIMTAIVDNSTNITKVSVKLSRLIDYNSNYLYDDETYFSVGKSITIGSKMFPTGIIIELLEIKPNERYVFELTENNEKREMILDVLEKNTEEIDGRMKFKIISADENGISLKIYYN